MATLTFSKNKEFLGPGSAVGIVAEAPKSPALALAMAQNKPFPPGTTEIGKVAVSAKAGKDVIFGKGAGKVSFIGKGAAFAGVGVFPSGAKVLGALDLDKYLGKVELPDVAGSHFVTMRWGYDVGASAKGSVALGAGLAPTFQADASRNAAFAIVRQLPKATGAKTSIRRVVNSWILPKQISSIDQLDPGTWVVAEVDGSIGLELGAQYGYDFNWVREAKLGGLSGDIGLRIQLGVAVALGFSASGRYAVVVSRDSLDAADKRIRLRLFKLKQKGWNFALNAGATVQGSTGKFLPGQFDQFIAAVFGLDPAQLIDDLKTLEEWTDPSKSFPELLAGAGVDAAKELLKDLSGLDIEQEFDKARNRVLELLDKWNKLDHLVATKLWSFIGKADDLAKVRAIAQQIAQASPESIRGLITERLSGVDFLNATPEGQWLAAALGDRLLSVLTNKTDLSRLQSIARKTIAVLDGGALEAILGRLHKRIGGKLGIDKIQKAVDENTFESLDAWLKAKLSQFLGSRVNFEKIEEIRKTIDLLLSKRQDFYEMARAALNRSYQFSFAATYQKNTARTALLDVVFDFGAADVSASLRGAVNGKFDDLLVKQVAGVKLNVAALTHEIDRQATVAIDLPFFKKNVTALNESLAKVSAVEDDGRVLLYDLNAMDLVTESVNAKTKRNSRLAIGGVVAQRLAGAGEPSQLREHSPGGLTYDYSFRQATANLRRRGLEFSLEPYVGTYFPSHFSPDAPFSAWLANIDRTIDDLDDNGPDVFGNTLISLQVSLPSAVTDAWLEAPTKKNAPKYREMSRQLQQAIKRTLLYYYFQNPKKYTSPLASARALLAYAAIPPSTSIALKGGGKVVFNTAKDILWDRNDANERKAMLNSSATATNLGRMLGAIHRRLQAEPGITKKDLSFYVPSPLNQRNVILAAQKTPGSALLRSLLLVEAQVVRAAEKAGLAMADFGGQVTEKPSLAVKALAQFGSAVTSAFNKKLKGPFDGGALRPLGSQLYAAAALAFDPSLDGKGAALAEMVVYKQSAAFPPEGFPDGPLPPPDPADVLVAQRLVNNRLRLGPEN